jgi:hypothetical protein
VPPTKKEIESEYLDRFRLAFPNFPEGRIESTEEPDFLVHRTDTTLGIEITELHRESPPGVRPQQASEAMRHRVVLRAQQLYELRGLPAVHVSVHMNTNFEIAKAEVEPLALAICDLVARNLPEVGRSSREEFDWINREYFPEELAEISVHQLAGIARTFFSCPDVTWVPTLKAADIARALAGKESKYEAYRRRCQEVWLLIISDSDSMSTWFEHDSDQLSEPIKSRFDRIFLFKQFSKRITELKVSGE